MPEQEIRVGGAKIPGMIVTSPKGVLPENFGQNEGKEDIGSDQLEAAETVKEAVRKGQKRIRYLGDDSQETDIDRIEEEETEMATGKDQEMEQERRIIGKA